MTLVEEHIERALSPHGFRSVPPAGPDAMCQRYWKLKTLNINRAAALIRLPALPEDFGALIKRARKEVAFRCHFVPIFYGVGIQLVIEIPDLDPGIIDLRPYVDRVDNQWAIIQSIFVVNGRARLLSSARTWWQYITGQYQDAIEAAFGGAPAHGAARSRGPDQPGPVRGERSSN